MSRHLIFVYGTLKDGCSNHHVLTGAKFIRTRWTEPKYAMFNLGYFPGVTLGDSQICGEVYEVTDAILKRLDYLEGHPTFYRREIMEKDYLEGLDLQYYRYLGHTDPKSLISNGIWDNSLRGGKIN